MEKVPTTTETPDRDLQSSLTRARIYFNISPGERWADGGPEIGIERKGETRMEMEIFYRDRWSAVSRYRCRYVCLDLLPSPRLRSNHNVQRAGESRAVRR